MRFVKVDSLLAIGLGHNIGSGWPRCERPWAYLPLRGETSFVPRAAVTSPRRAKNA